MVFQFEIAADGCRAGKAARTAPSPASGSRKTVRFCAHDCSDCGYDMLWGDETLRSDRIGLEKAAIRILKWMLRAKSCEKHAEKL